MSRTPHAEDVIEGLAARRAEHARSDLLYELETFQSPIEQTFVAAMLSHGWRTAFDAGLEFSVEAVMKAEKRGLLGLERVARFGSEVRLYIEGWPHMWMVCVAQPTMRLRDRTIRPDFAVLWTADEHAVDVIVELDGHDFHERTPEQAQSDKSRDRELQALGWSVLRYTGREVLRSPVDCLHEVERLVQSKSRAVFDASTKDPSS